MAKIIVDSAELDTIANFLYLDSVTLKQCTDEDDLDVVEYCADSVQDNAIALRKIISCAEQVEGVKT